MRSFFKKAVQSNYTCVSSRRLPSILKAPNATLPLLNMGNTNYRHHSSSKSDVSNWKIKFRDPKVKIYGGAVVSLGVIGIFGYAIYNGTNSTGSKSTGNRKQDQSGDSNIQAGGDVIQNHNYFEEKKEDGFSKKKPQ